MRMACIERGSWMGYIIPVRRQERPETRRCGARVCGFGYCKIPTEDSVRDLMDEARRSGRWDALAWESMRTADYTKARSIWHVNRAPRPFS